MVRFSILGRKDRKKDPAVDSDEDEVEVPPEELIGRIYDLAQLLARDSDVSESVRGFKSLVPWDSYKIDFALVPQNLEEYYTRSFRLSALFEVITSDAVDDERIKFINSYIYLTELRIRGAREGRLLYSLLGVAGRR